MSLMSFTNGQTSVVVRVKILDSSATDGSGLTGLLTSSTGLIISTICDNEATATTYTAAGGTIAGITTLGTWSGPPANNIRFKEVDSTNHPGLYELQIANSRMATSGAKYMVITISGATNCAETDVLIPMTSFDPYDSVRGGLTALPNANADAAGGLPISDAGGLDLDAVLADTNEVQQKLAGTGTVTLAALTVNGATTLTGALTSTNASNNITLGTLTVTTNAIAWNASWDTEVQSEVADGLTDFFTSSAQLVDDIYDEAYSDHTTAGTFGKLFDLIRKSNLATESTVAASPTPSTTSFGTSLTDSDDTWNEQVILFTTGNLAGQAKPISDFANTNGVISVSEAFSEAPTASDEFVIIPSHVHTLETIADAVLKRAVSNVESTADKHSLGAVVMLSTNAVISGTDIIAKKPSDDSTFATYAITTSASADNLTGIS